MNFDLIDLYDIIDLSHSIESDIPFWDEKTNFHLEINDNYEKNGYLTHIYHLDSGYSTHIDSPIHFNKESGLDISSLELKQLFCKYYIIDISLFCEKNSTYKLSLQDCLDFEVKNGEIEANSFVFCYTGWSKKWKNKIEYRGIDKNGDLNFPSISKEAAEFFVKRNVNGIGIDTLSPDIDFEFPVHKIMLGNNKIIAENVKIDFEKLNNRNGYVLIAPLKIKNGSEAPSRIYAFINK